MAYKKAFVDSSGVTHSDCYWIPLSWTDTNKMKKTQEIVFVGYHNQQAREDGLTPLPGARRRYLLSKTGREIMGRTESLDYDTYLVDVDAEEGESLESLQARISYMVANDYKDVKNPEFDDQEEASEENPLWMSFFAGAEEV